MRVWNEYNIPSSPVIKSFWSYLWGFETHCLHLPANDVSEFWSYLWGFETRTSACRFPPAMQVLELPMRVWNSLSPAKRPVTSIRFGVTYEGLKQRSEGKKEKRYPPRFGVTYEGLKRDSDIMLLHQARLFWSYLWGFETWKCRPNRCWIDLVLELPMRVWNIRQAKARCEADVVLELPMRVWNFWVTISEEGINLVLELPMRVWNWLPAIARHLNL